MNLVFVDKHIDLVRCGDLVLCEDGVVRTVCPRDIRRCSFMGVTLWGDSYRLGTRPVKVALPRNPCSEVESYEDNLEICRGSTRLP